MKQAYLADAVAGVPASSGAPSVGNPSDGDPANGVEATALGAYAMFQLFTELEAVIDQGGLTADVDTLTQVRDAILAMIDASGFDEAAGDVRYLRRAQNLGDVNNAGHCTRQPRCRAPCQPVIHRQPLRAYAVNGE